jgi:metallo-beta-lactamase family protein
MPALVSGIQRMRRPISVQFLGAAGTVTGSKHLVRFGDQQVLLDCGLFQGLKELRLRNWREPPFAARDLSAVVLSHAHIDHCGYLPVLPRDGYRGPVYCSSGTADLLHVMLPDAAHLQEEDAEAANRYGYSKHRPALPLYTLRDAEAVLRLLRPERYDQTFSVANNIQAVLRPTAHILGSASIELDLGTTEAFRLVFTGDLGRWHRPILRDPELVKTADLLLTEATYGNRTHPADTSDRLARIVSETANRGGALVVPAFAVGRTQELLWILRQLEDARRVPILPVYLDSPMAINVSEIYARHPEDHNLDMQKLIDAHQCPLSSHQFHVTRTRDESKAINALAGPLVIISANGMATGGRVLHHLKQRLPDSRNTVLLPGFQSEGTRGRALQDGARFLRIHGQDVPVRAKVERIDGLSAHADRGELLRWFSGFTTPPKMTYIVHGELDAAQSLAGTLQTELGWNAQVAHDLQTVEIP